MIPCLKERSSTARVTCSWQFRRRHFREGEWMILNIIARLARLCRGRWSCGDEGGSSRTPIQSGWLSLGDGSVRPESRRTSAVRQQHAAILLEATGCRCQPIQAAGAIFWNRPKLTIICLFQASIQEELLGFWANRSSCDVRLWARAGSDLRCFGSARPNLTSNRPSSSPIA